MASVTPKRCAIYTRKSSEEGLEQDFNSLHAQREACEAFVKSQAGEGWRLLKSEYNDGGFSGGTMERPGLQQLLADIRERRVDVVVVYKVDRLTRSLADFARMVELFDAHGVSFVAVTQQFNTTTSMGRLTLNVLLSFAQFEREVIGQRIRDKIAASKRKGMWLGGTAPMGYRIRERKLVIHEVEAAIVVNIFQRYLELSNVHRLKTELDARGVVSSVKVTRKGVNRGGKSFSRGALYKLLSNPVYAGRISHKGQSYPGQHPAIIGDELWTQVQERLRSRTVKRTNNSSASSSPLAGKVFDENGEPLYVQGAANGQRRYRYYVSRKLVRGEAGEEQGGWRLSAPELERAVSDAAQAMLGDHAAITDQVDDRGALQPALKGAEEMARKLRNSAEAAETLAAIIDRVELTQEGVRLRIKLPLFQASNRGAAQETSLTLDRISPLQFKRRGVELRMVLGGEASGSGRIDLPLLSAVARARRWGDELVSGQVVSVRELARREKIDVRSLRRLLPLGFLSPRVVEAIAEGRQPPELTVTGFRHRAHMPLLWTAQAQALRVAGVEKPTEVIPLSHRGNPADSEGVVLVLNTKG